jgi:hypothetical protein
MMKKGQIMMKKAKMDNKSKKLTISGFLQENMKNVGNDEK